MKEDKIKYKVKGIRMDERTWKKLKEARCGLGLSWNKFLLSLVDKDYKKLLSERLAKAR